MRRWPCTNHSWPQRFGMLVALGCALVLMGAKPPPVPYAPKPTQAPTSRPSPPQQPMVQLRLSKPWWSSESTQGKEPQPPLPPLSQSKVTPPLQALCPPLTPTTKADWLSSLCFWNQGKDPQHKRFVATFLQRPSPLVSEWSQMGSRWLSPSKLAPPGFQQSRIPQEKPQAQPPVRLEVNKLKAPHPTLYPQPPKKPLVLEPPSSSRLKRQPQHPPENVLLGSPLSIDTSFRLPLSFPFDDEQDWPPRLPEDWPDVWPESEPPETPNWQAQWDRGDILKSAKLVELQAQARTLWERKQFASAIRLYKQLLEARPWHVPSLHKLARWYAWRKDYPSAKQTYQDILLYNPGTPDAHRGLGDIEFWSGKYSEAVRWYKLYLQRRPKELVIWRNLGRAAAKANDDKTARRAYKHILKNKPGDMEAQLYLAPKPRFSINAFTHQSFASQTLRQEYHFAFGMRLIRKLWAVAEADFRVRFHPSLTFADVFFSGALYWTPLAWDKLTLSLQMGGSPFSTIAPQFYLNAEASVHLYWVELHAGYRFFLFPIRQSHLVSPGVTVHLAPVHIHLRYFLSLSELEGLPLQARHSFYGYIRWQARPWLGLLAGGGGGNALDFLSDYVRPFLDQGVASQNFTEFTFHVQLGSQFRIAFRQHLMLNYTYSSERFRQSNTQDPIDADLHTATIGYRIRF
ncbi:MAG: tetratricopeptide repeat protein [Deltaproteobacteria bacterium]|nr:MAG: tetratricopeptide repeat protein [Deltaproteobacteria bacterium]